MLLSSPNSTAFIEETSLTCFYQPYHGNKHQPSTGIKSWTCDVNKAVVTHTSGLEYSWCILGLSSDELPFSREWIAFDKSFLGVFQTHNLVLRYGQSCWWGLTLQLSSRNTSDLEMSQNSFAFRNSLSPYKFWSLTKKQILAHLNFMTTKIVCNNSISLLEGKQLKETSFLHYVKEFSSSASQIFWEVTQYFHISNWTRHEFGFGYWQVLFLPPPQQCKYYKRSSEYEIPGNSLQALKARHVNQFCKTPSLYLHPHVIIYSTKVKYIIN